MAMAASCRRCSHLRRCGHLRHRGGLGLGGRGHHLSCRGRLGMVLALLLASSSRRHGVGDGLVHDAPAVAQVLLAGHHEVLHRLVVLGPHGAVHALAHAQLSGHGHLGAWLLTLLAHHLAHPVPAPRVAAAVLEAPRARRDARREARLERRDVGVRHGGRGTLGGTVGAHFGVSAGLLAGGLVDGVGFGAEGAHL
eukprot:673680-Prorocentrum_minimum.AAC.1